MLKNGTWCEINRMLKNGTWSEINRAGGGGCKPSYGGRAVGGES
jgi:hypothetical protein